MAYRSLPEISYLRQIIRYEPDTGNLYWLYRPSHMFKCKQAYGAWNTKYCGKMALATLNSKGYFHGTIDRISHIAHRIAWALHYGAWPFGEVDHINTIRADNRISNLRDTPRSGNQQNKGKQSNNTSGFKGVCMDKRTGLWFASICCKGKKRRMGYFPSAEAAHVAYCEAAKELHGEFARTA